MPEFLTDEEILKLRLEHKLIKDKKLADRIKAILYLHYGMSYSQITKLLLLDETTIRRYAKEFQKKGLKGLLACHYTGGKSKLTVKQENLLKNHCEKHTPRTVMEVVKYVFEKYQIEYSTIGMTKLLHRLGFSYKKPKIIPGKADTVKQAEFIAKYNQIKNSLKTNDQIYFVDSTHPQHNTRPSYGWILKGKKNDKIIKTNTGRERLNLAGALNLSNKQAVVLSEKTINRQVTLKLLKKLESAQPHGKIYLILDNASYYHAKVVTDYVKGKRIKLLFLPSYSPNLNIIERLWKFFHQKITYNHYFATFAEFKKQTLNFFKNLKDYQPELDSLLTDNFQRLPNLNLQT